MNYIFRKPKTFLFLTFLFLGVFLFPAVSGAIELQVGASTDDASNGDSYSGNDLTGANIIIYANTVITASDYNRGGFRFTNVAIPQGATINVAYLSLNVVNFDDPNFRIYAENVNNAANFTAGGIKDRPLTTTYTDWVANDIGLGLKNSPSLAGIIQEIINRTGWVSGNALNILAIPYTNNGNRLAAVSYDSNPANAAKLFIEYVGEPDTTPPVRSNPQPSGPLAADTTQTTISLTTNESATCKYSATAGTIYSSMPYTFSTISGASHSSTVTGLTNGSSYIYYVRCQNTAGYVNTDDNFFISFSVASAADTTPPVISNISASNIAASSATINWTTDDLSTSIVNYGTTVSLGLNVSSSNLVTSHSINLTSLSSNTTYYYQVRSCNSDNYCTNSSTFNFTTSAPTTGNSTILGSLSLIATFKSIGVIANYTEDNNGNNSAVLEYKEKNASAWKQAHPMSLVGGDRIRKQWAASIVMLNPNTEYDVRVIYTDTDSVSGTNPVTGSVKTRDENFPTGGGTVYYVSTAGSDIAGNGSISNPWRTIQKAANVVNPGDIVFIRGGTYREAVTLKRSGIASAYISFQNYPGETVNIDGSDEAIANGQVVWTSYGGGIYYTDLNWSAISGDSMGYAAVDGQKMYFYKSKFNTFDNFQTDSWVVNRSSWYWDSNVSRLYVKLVNVGNPDPNAHNIIVGRRSIGFYIDGYGVTGGLNYIIFKGINVLNHQQKGIETYRANNLLIDSCTVSGYGNVGIYSKSGDNVTVQNCRVIDGDMRQVPWNALKRTEQETGGINVKEGQVAVIRNNIVEGGMDAISLGGGSSGTWQDDTDVYDNSISKTSDDGLSLDIYNGKNVRAWGNTITGGISPISVAPTVYGPIYVFRNTVFKPSVNSAAFKLGYNSPSVGSQFYYHNSVYLPDAGVGVSSYGGDYLRNAILRNNIVFIGYTAANAYAVYNNFVGTSFLAQWDMDYDDLFTLGSILVRWRRIDISYATLATFQAGTGEELNGISADPQFVDQANGDLRLQATSPAIDKGVVIANFNDQNSAWPYQGTAPDMGAFEYGSSTPPPPPPPQSFTISNTAPLYLFRDQVNTLSVTGTNFNLATNFYLRFLSGGTTISSITSQPQTNSSFNISMTSAQVNALSVGFYDLKLERSTDGEYKTYSQQILVTVLGDVSSQTSGVRDGKVNIYDVSRLLSKWGSANTQDLAEADINAGPGNISQGKIDLYDANKIMVNWRP